VLLIFLYVLFIALFGTASVFLGFVIEGMWGKLASLTILLSINMLSLWVGWAVAVKLPEPKAREVT
jgi:hypothetical protein